MDDDVVLQDFAEFFQLQDELYCMRVDESDYCIRELAAGGFYDGNNNDDDGDAFGDTLMGLRCTACGRAVTSVAIRVVGGSTATFATVAYGCADRGRDIDGTNYCVNDFVDSAVSIETACADSNILDADQHSGLNCSNACGEAIRGAAAMDGCCTRGSLLVTALRNRPSQFTPPVPNLDHFLLGITATCSPVSPGDIPSRCTGPTAAPLKTKVGNVLASYVRSAPEAILGIANTVQFDLSRQVGGPIDSIRIGQWTALSDGIVFDVSLLLESDTATTGAAAALARQSLDGTIVFLDTQRTLLPLGKTALINPLEPVSLQVQPAASGNTFPAAPGSTSDPNGAGRAAGVIGATLAMSSAALFFVWSTGSAAGSDA